MMDGGIVRSAVGWRLVRPEDWKTGTESRGQALWNRARDYYRVPNFNR